MKVVTEEHYIPERRYTTTKYIASDGKEFSTEEACLIHEKQLEIENPPVIRNAIFDIEIYGDEYHGNLYYLSNADDYEFLIKALNIKSAQYSKLNSDFYDYGKGWYLYWCEHGSYHDYHELHNYNAYVEQIENDFKEWKEDIQRKLSESAI